MEILKQLKAIDKEENDRELDEEGFYAQSVASTLRTMTPQQKALAKIKIQQILYETHNCMSQSSYLENYHSISNEF